MESQCIPKPTTIVSQVHLLDECNLKCKHCYVGDWRFSPRPMPSTETMMARIRKIVDFSKKQGFKRHVMNISGGEPTLRSDIFEIIKEVRKNDANPLLLTNGMLFTKEYVKKIKNAGCDSVQISIEGPEDLNDLIRGRGTFQKIMSAIRNCKDEGFNVTAGVTVSKVNISGFCDLVGTLDGKVDKFHVSELVQIGAGTGMEPLSKNERFELYKFVYAWNGKSKVFIEDPTYCSISPDLADKRAGCGAFICLMCVDTDGSVYPCRRAPMKMGTVDDLEGAWLSEIGVKLRSRDFTGQCGRCDLKWSCGGCRAYATSKGNILGSDERCFL